MYFSLVFALYILTKTSPEVNLHSSMRSCYVPNEKFSLLSVNSS